MPAKRQKRAGTSDVLMTSDSQQEDNKNPSVAADSKEEEMAKQAAPIVP